MQACTLVCSPASRVICACQSSLTLTVVFVGVAVELLHVPFHAVRFNKDAPANICNKLDHDTRTRHWGVYGRFEVSFPAKTPAELFNISNDADAAPLFNMLDLPGFTTRDADLLNTTISMLQTKRLTALVVMCPLDRPFSGAPSDGFPASALLISRCINQRKGMTPTSVP